MRIRIEGTDFPGTSCGPSPQRPDGHANVHVGVQRRGKPAELLGVVSGDSPAAAWTLEATVTSAPGGGVDVTGPYIQGPPGGRFIYLNWGTVDAPGTFAMFRRAKLRLDAVPPELLRDAQRQGFLVARVTLTDPQGNPVCASLRPPVIEWSAAPR
jgi:sugar/nucleoside kinase (ribokinase family)